MIDSPFRT